MKEINKSWWHKQFIIVTILFSFIGCIEKSTLAVSGKKKSSETLRVTVSNIQVINHQIVLTGTHLDSVTAFNVKEGSTITNFQIESKTSTSMIANTLSNVTFAAGKVFDFILSSANATATFTINFSLCDSTLGGTAYSGELNRGHSDGAPLSKLAASTDNDGCSGTLETCSDVVWNSQRRTNTLSNGEVIWDLGGNLLEWVSDNNVISQGASDYASMLSTGDSRQVRYGNDQFCATPTASPYCGMGYGNVGGSSGAVLRGGYLNDGELAGVFATLMNYTPTDVDAAVGFRCVFVP